MLAVQKSFQLERVEIGEKLVRVVGEFGFVRVLAFLRLGLREFEHDLQIFDALVELRERLDFALDVVGFGDDFLRGFLIVPKIVAGHLRLEFGEALGQFGHVKETSASA
jgi:hypothetical protein